MRDEALAIRREISLERGNDRRQHTAYTFAHGSTDLPRAARRSSSVSEAIPFSAADFHGSESRCVRAGSHCKSVVATVNGTNVQPRRWTICASSRPETCFTPSLRALDQPRLPGLCLPQRAANLRSLHKHSRGHRLLSRPGRRIPAVLALPPSTHLLALYE